MSGLPYSALKGLFEKGKSKIKEKTENPHALVCACGAKERRSIRLAHVVTVSHIKEASRFG